MEARPTAERGEWVEVFGAEWRGAGAGLGKCSWLPGNAEGRGRVWLEIENAVMCFSRRKAVQVQV